MAIGSAILTTDNHAYGAAKMYVFCFQVIG